MPKKPAAVPPPVKSNRGRKPLAPAAKVMPEFDDEKLAERRHDLALMGQMDAETAARADRLAVSLGFEGPHTPEALWDRVSFFQRRSVEDVLELGRTLVLLKEITPHGDFLAESEARGIHRRMGRRFMAVALKFSKRDSKSLLCAAATQTKVLELAVLDDEDIEALESDEPVGNLTLDSIERMGVSELRHAIREHKKNQGAAEDRAAARQKRIEELEDQLADASNFLRVTKPDKVGQRLLIDANGLLMESRQQIVRIRKALDTLAEHDDQHALDIRGGLESQLGDWTRAAADLLAHLRLMGIGGGVALMQAALGA